MDFLGINMFVIKCNTPEEVRKQIVDWLASEAISYSARARISNRVLVANELRAKADALSAAAKFISEIRIEVL